MNYISNFNDNNNIIRVGSICKKNKVLENNKEMHYYYIPWRDWRKRKEVS